MLFVQASFVEMTQNGRPSLLEQSMIVKRLDSQERLVLAEKGKMEKLLRLKTGLMQDLLTGKVRVKADDGEVVR